MKAALANYAGFHDLWRYPNRFHPIGELDNLYFELAEKREFGETGFTNILAIGKADVGFFR